MGITVSAVVGTTSAGAILLDAAGAVNVLAEPPADVRPRRNCQELWMRFLGQAATDPVLSVLVVSG
jgi:hypothetical protein